MAGRTLARIGYGAMQLRRLRGDRAAGAAMLRRAVELGIGHIDAAQFYGNGFVNSLIEAAIRPDGHVLIASKVGATPDPGGPYPMRPAQRPERLRAAYAAWVGFATTLNTALLQRNGGRTLSNPSTADT